MTKRHLFVLLLAAVAGALPLFASADVLDDLRQQLSESRQRLFDIQQRITEYRNKVSEHQAQASTLKTQISVIDQQVQGLQLELDKTKVEIESVQTESSAVREEITLAEAEIDNKRGQLRETLRVVQLLESSSAVEAFFTYPTLSGALIQLRALERLQQKTHEMLGEIKALRLALEKRAEALRDLERELLELKRREEQQKATLEEQQQVKARLYELTLAEESKFQSLLASAAAEQRRVNAEITAVERQVREELERRGVVQLKGVGTFDWPIDPIFGIACGFHCAGYPYQAVLGPHAGIDLPTHMGTPVRAAADGYVARAHDAGGPGYSYVLLLHGDDFSTVYGHLSSVSVGDGQFVTRGQVIGASGGIPGTRGAGLSTGPHLHFEVRKNGIPTNPLPYLP